MRFYPRPRIQLPAVAWFCWLGIAFSPVTAHPIQEETPAAQSRAWQQVEPYSPPDYEGFFPFDEEGGRTLDRLYRGGGLKDLDDAAFIEAYRRGMRCKTEYDSHITQALGRRFLWSPKGESPQNADAIELFYHMAGSPGLCKYAIKNGLTWVKDQTPSLLHAMVDLCMATDSVKDLNRILAYCDGHTKRMLPWLDPHLQSHTETVRAKAESVRAMLLGTLTPKQWSMQPKPVQAMPELRRILREGTEAEVLAALDGLFGLGPQRGLDPGIIDDLARHVQSKNHRLRKQVVPIAAQIAISNPKELNAKALDLLIKLSRDPEREVREAVVYDALRLARIAQSEAGQTRMLEMVVDPYNARSHGDLLWALRRSGVSLKPRLLAELSGSDKARAWASYELYLRIFEQIPSGVPTDIFPPSELTGSWKLEITAPPNHRYGGGRPNVFDIPTGFHPAQKSGEEFVQPVFQNLLWIRVGSTLHLSCNAYIEGAALFISARLEGDSMQGITRLSGGGQQVVWKAAKIQKEE